MAYCYIQWCIMQYYFSYVITCSVFNCNMYVIIFCISCPCRVNLILRIYYCNLWWYIRKEYRKYGKSRTVSWLLLHIATHIFMRQPHMYNAVQVWSHTHTYDHTQQYANIIHTHTHTKRYTQFVNILSSVFLDFFDFFNIFLCVPDDCHIKRHENRGRR